MQTIINDMLEARANYELNKVDLTEQKRLLKLINQYNNTDRKTIKTNFKRILKQFNITPADIIQLGYKSPNVYSWSAMAANNIPMFDQALTISVNFSFDIREFLQELC